MSNGNSTRKPDGTFKKGYTANPNGPPQKARRKRIALALDILEHPAFDPVAADLPADLSPEDEPAYRVLQTAFTGSKRAIRQVLKHIIRRDEERIKRARAEGPLPQVKKLLEPCDPRNVDEALLLLQIALEDQEKAHPADEHPRFKLLPWAVQAAISRRHGGKRLTPSEMKRIEFSTDKANELYWPRGYGEQRR